MGEARGKQELFTRQSPQKLKALRENAIIESAVSSNRIEGVEIDQKRVGTVVFGKADLRDRNEEEIRGYRDALEYIHEHGKTLEINEDTIRHLHLLSRGGEGDAGQYKIQPNDIIEKYPDGRSRVRFQTVKPEETAAYMKSLIELWRRCLNENWVHPLIALAAFNLDFLCIHPFHDGNGRVSRLLFLLQTYHLGYEVGRYIVLEKIIEENKERFRKRSTQARRIGIGKARRFSSDQLLLYILSSLTKFLKSAPTRNRQSPRRKTEMIERDCQSAKRVRIAELKKLVPNASLDMIRKFLRDNKKTRVNRAGRTRTNALEKDRGNNNSIR